ncbi:MAG: O-antigen ligase family protein [Alistipes sp.]
MSIPRVLLGGLLAASIALIAYVMTHYGVPAGMAIAILPLGLCLLWFSLSSMVVSMFLMFIVNFYIMALGRYVHNFPIGTLLDLVIFYNILLLTFQALVHKIEWRNLGSGLTIASLIWLVYCSLELVNPETVSTKGWFINIRSVALYMFFITALTQLTLTKFKYLKYMLVILSVLTLTAVIKACIQKYFGFNAAENYWLFVDGGQTTHIIYTGIRYFSFFSDAANFGGCMGLSMVILSISALYYRNPWMKVYLMLVAAAACYGMLISGTRSALAVPFVGYAVFAILSGSWKISLFSGIAIIMAVLFLNFTTIGQSNAIIRRARSAFNTQDASFQVRLQNQEKLRALMVDKPFGGGIGHGGGKAKAFAPNAPLTQIPTDSWFVMIWVETGIVGILLHLSVLLYILGWGAYQVLFRLKNVRVRGFTTALIAGISGIVVMSYANEVLGQIPIGPILYMGMAFIFLSPRFDREVTETEAKEAAALAAHTAQFY